MFREIQRLKDLKISGIAGNQLIITIVANGKKRFPRPPPHLSAEAASVAEGVTLDYDFTFDKCYIEPVEMLSAGFEQNCI